MSKKHDTHESKTKELEVKPLTVNTLVKVRKDGEVVFVGNIIEIEGDTVRVVCGGAMQAFDAKACEVLGDGEAERFRETTTQSSLGMGNIIDAVVNGGE